MPKNLIQTMGYFLLEITLCPFPISVKAIVDAGFIENPVAVHVYVSKMANFYFIMTGLGHKSLGCFAVNLVSGGLW